MKIQKFILVLVIIVSSSARAVNPPRKSHFVLDLGAHVSNVDLRGKVASEYSGNVSVIQGLVRLRTALNIGKGFYIEPAFGTLLPWQANHDGTTKTYSSYLELNLSAEKKWFRCRAGSGLKWQMLSAKGESIVQNNGTGSSTFYIPDRTTHVWLATVQAGISINFSARIALNFDVYSTGLLSTDRRHFHGALSLGIRL